MALRPEQEHSLSLIHIYVELPLNGVVGHHVDCIDDLRVAVQRVVDHEGPAGLVPGQQGLHQIDALAREPGVELSLIHI